MEFDAELLMRPAEQIGKYRPIMIIEIDVAVPCTLIRQMMEFRLRLISWFSCHESNVENGCDTSTLEWLGEARVDDESCINRRSVGTGPIAMLAFRLLKMGELRSEMGTGPIAIGDRPR